MEQLTLQQAAEKHSTHAKSPVGSILYIFKVTAFKSGAKWQQEQCKDLLNSLKTIAAWAGNLPDHCLNTATGPNDARYRGGMVISMRQIAVDAIKKIDPEYKAF